MEPTDAELVSRAVRGDGPAFGALMQRHGRPVVALLRRLVDGQEDVEDLLQDTLIHAWRDLGKLQDATRLRAWLLQIARNRCRDHWKAQGRLPVRLEAEPLEVAANRYGRAARRTDEQVEAAQEALEQVRRPLRETAALFYAEGLSITEIARQLQCPAGTVKRRLHEARRHMRHSLGLYEEE